MANGYSEQELISMGFIRECGNTFSDGKKMAYGVVSGCGQCSYCEAEDNGGNCLNATITFYISEN